jgi:arylsulfatase A-like enzyme
MLFCFADDWSFGHAGVYGDPVIQTPTFDRVARQGVLFTHAFSATPSCTPSRAAVLTGQAPHRLEQGGNLFGFLPKRFPVYPDLLDSAGYTVGFARKGWGPVGSMPKGWDPGSLEAGGRTRNPAGPRFDNFADFLKFAPADKPFCFWFGSTDPHRPYKLGTGLSSGMNPAKVKVPPLWPDTPEVRGDILDYYFAAQRFDRESGEMLNMLEKTGQLQNTIVVMSGDNGWPFPRCKANLYDGGTRQPLAVSWPAGIKGGRVLDDFINLTDLAPTFLEAAGLKPLPEMTGRSFFRLLTGDEKPGSRNTVFVERERHASVRPGLVGYPIRAVRTTEFLYIRNFHPERWPAGDPDPEFFYGPYGDCDPGPTKQTLVSRQKEFPKQFELSFAKRPAEELYNVRQDPHNMTNLAADPKYRSAKQKMRASLDRWMKGTADPRATGGGDPWDHYPYFGQVLKR